MTTTTETQNDFWVFGYGSLLWNPGFPYEDKVIGYVQGYKRRFWLLNTTHRGVPGQPGRVATLVTDPELRVWGVAYKIPEENVTDVKNCLALREKDYTTHLLTFHPRESNRDPMSIILYISSPDHPNFNEATEQEIVEDIRNSSGPSGSNSEYLFKLAEFVRMNIPEDEDDHLFELEDLLRQA